MDSKDIGASLNTVYEINGGLGDMLELLKDGSGTIGSSFLPSIMLLVPQSYFTRDNRRVDICGTVKEGTVEYQEGFRFYSSEGEFFYADGKCSHEDESPCDLVSLITSDDLARTTKPVSPYWWVHPQHWVIKTWFSPINHEKISLQCGNRYFNHMGLVIQLVSFYDKDGETIFRDKDDRHYTAQGTRLDLPKSMFDLHSCIKHWEMFIEIDWASDRGLAKRTAQKNIPEMFDPTGGAGKKALQRRFLQQLMEVNDLADQLGIDLGFDIKTRDFD